MQSYKLIKIIMKKYPKEIYVQREIDGNTSYLLCDEKIEDRDNGVVAIYKLEKIVKKSTKVVIE